MTKGTGLLAILCSASLAVFAQGIEPTRMDGARPHPKTPLPAGNAREGITKDQADAILSELRQIRQLLEKQQNGSGQAAAAPERSHRVSMTMRSDWYALGRADAPLTLVEFTDYQCPFCRNFHASTFATLKKNYIDPGTIRFISRDLPLDFHSNAFAAAQAALCAGEQGRFWEMRNELIANSADLSSEAILKYSRAISLNAPAFSACVEAQTHKEEIQKDLADATALQIGGTPTFVLGKVADNVLSGVVIVGAQPYAAFDTAIQQLLNPNK